MFDDFVMEKLAACRNWRVYVARLSGREYAAGIFYMPATRELAISELERRRMITRSEAKILRSETGLVSWEGQRTYPRTGDCLWCRRCNGRMHACTGTDLAEAVAKMSGALRGAISPPAEPNIVDPNWEVGPDETIRFSIAEGSLSGWLRMNMGADLLTGRRLTDLMIRLVGEVESRGPGKNHVWLAAEIVSEDEVDNDVVVSSFLYAPKSLWICSFDLVGDRVANQLFTTGVPEHVIGVAKDRAATALNLMSL